MVRKLSRNTKILSIVSFLVDVSSEMIIPIIPFFITAILGAPVLLLGILEGLRESTVHIAGFFSGFYADKRGKHKIFVLAGYGISALMKAFLILVKDAPQAAAVLIIERIGKGIRDAPRDAIINYSEEKQNLGNAFGFRKMLDNAGAIAGPLLVIFFIAFFLPFSQNQEQTLRLIFTIAVIPAVIAVLLVFLVREVKQKQLEEKNIFLALKQFASNPSYRIFVESGAVFSLGHFTVAFFLLYIGSFSLVAVPLAYLTYNAFYTVFSLPAGNIIDKWGAKKGLLLAYGFFALAIFGFLVFNSLIGGIVMFALLGLSMAFKEIAPKVLVSSLSGKEEYATAAGFYNGAIGIIALPANLLAGFLWSFNIFGSPAIFIFSLVTTLMAMGLTTKITVK